MQETLMGFTESRKKELLDAMRAAIELHHQGAEDWCGDQRKYHLPRAQTLMLFMLKTFPNFAVEAMEGAVDGWGNPL